MRRIDRTGQKFITNEKEEVEIIESINNKINKIRFSDGTILEKVSIGRLNRGEVKKPIPYFETEYLSKEGYPFKVINKYGNADKFDIQFENGHIVKGVQSNAIKLRNIKNPYHKKYYGVGYLGVGKYVTSINGKNLIVYSRWRGILRRCYGNKESEKNYRLCSVCEEWHNFQNFAEWFENNNIKNYEIDKDILRKGNKIYSSETCCFVPQEINSLFVNPKNKKSKYPIGVRKSGKRYSSRCLIKGVDKHLGMFDTPEEAFQAYKTAKEAYIKEVADEWKPLIGERVYQAMHNWVVEITD